jgi:outer membrane lipoprotein SlyB
MLFTKRSLLLFSLTAVSLLLISCTTTHIGNGTIVAEKKLDEKDIRLNQNAKKGSQIGATIGSISGGVYGGIVGLFVGAITTNSVGVAAVTTALGTVGGALVGGAALGAAFGGIGSAIDASKPNVSLYEFTVKSDDTQKNLIITQYSSTPIPLQSRVQILAKGETLTLKELQK